MRYLLTTCFMVFISLGWSQTLSAEELQGYYSGSQGSIVLRADGSASLPSALKDPSADGVRWRQSGDDSVWLTPFYYSGPREFNNTNDLTPVLFEVEQRDGKIILSTRTLTGNYIFSK